MLKNLFKTKKELTDDAIIKAVVSQTSDMLTHMHREMSLRFNEISSQIKELEHGLSQLETKLLTKDLKDKQAYGILHYKLHEAKSKKLIEEIEELETALKNKEIKTSDH